MWHWVKSTPTDNMWLLNLWQFLFRWFPFLPGSVVGATEQSFPPHHLVRTHLFHVTLMLCCLVYFNGQHLNLCVCDFFFCCLFALLFSFSEVRGESNLSVHPGNRLVLVNNVLRFLLLVEIAVNVSPCSDLRVLALLSPVWTWPWWHHSNCTLKAANRDTVWRQWHRWSWMNFRVVQGANWNSNFRDNFSEVDNSTWGMHKCDSYFAGDDRNLLNIRMPFSFNRSRHTVYSD